MTALVETVGQLLGLRSGLTNRLDLARMIRDGLPHGVVERVKGLLDLSDRELAAAMGVSQKTVGRLRKSGTARVNPVAGDRLYRMARLYALAREVTGGEEPARQWLRSPQFGLAGQTPLESMLTEAGAREVEDLLGRIEHGVLA
jgi:putative toxin-antitoxin system antitoxin component (TIGR02293 family)